MVQALAWSPLASRDTLSCKENLAHLPVEEFDPGDTLPIAGIHVQTYSTSHDVINPVGYRFNALDDSIGFATDTGELSSKAIGILKDCRVLALESNHDVTMLREGAYPAFFRSASCPQRGTSPTTRPPKPRANLLPIAPNSSSPCISARTIIVQALPSKAMPTRLMQVSMMNSAVLPPVFKGHGSSRYALQASINRQPFNSPSRQQRGWESLPSPLNSYSIEAEPSLVDRDLRDVLLLDNLGNRNGQDAVSILSRRPSLEASFRYTPRVCCTSRTPSGGSSYPRFRRSPRRSR